MLNVNEVWSRVSQLPQYQGLRLAQYIIQAWCINQQLTSLQVVENIPIVFAPGSIIVGVAGAARPTGQTALQTYPPGNDLYKISISDQQSNRSIVGRTKAIGTSVFGLFNDLFPDKELIIPVQGALIYGFENMTSTTIDITITHQILVPNAIS